MKIQPITLTTALLLVMGVASLQGCGKATAQDVTQAAKPRSGDIRLMIYKQDFATIQEVRPIELREGRNRVQLDSVSKSLDPNSVIFNWPEGSTHPEIVSNTYDLGIGNGGSLLSRLEGKEVDMLWNTKDGKPTESLHGTLEASREGGIVIRSDGKLYVNPDGTIVAPPQPGLVTLPTLSAEVESKAAATSNLDFAYQTRGMSWSADYTAKLSQDGESVALECWATVENHTGVDFQDAKLTLMAGAPNRAVSERSHEYDLEDRAASKASPMFQTNSPQEFQPQAVGELYAYKVPSLASIGQEQMNRVKMLSSDSVRIAKDYNIEIQPGYSYYGSDGGSTHQNAQLTINWQNTEDSGLGMPLPSGTVRVYDTNGGQAAYVGASSIRDIAKDQRVSMTLSKVFDVYSDSRLVSTRRVDKRTSQRSYEVVMHNEKKSPVTLRLTQALYGKKKMVSESSPSRKLDATRVEWKILLQPGETKKLTYTANFGS